MVEIAISLAVIGIALVAIIGVLPIGMNTQRDNREETIINQDATVLMEAIRGGAHGMDDLTNYVYAITNFGGQYNNGVLTLFSSPPPIGYINYPSFLTNGANIVGLLSMPEFTDPTNYYAPIENPSSFNVYNSNHIVAYVRSISGPAVEKPPQTNDIVVGDSFGYRILCVNAPVAVNTNLYNTLLYPNGPPAYNKQLAANLHELRLTFLWPQLPNGNVGPGRQTFRTMVAGQIVQTNYYNNSSPWLYFYQSQSFVNVTNAP
jgi:type II secretory pathway pseudopilin PulG